MNILNELFSNFKHNKTCLFCNSKLEENKVEKILHLEFNPYYCDNCTIDYADYNDGMLRIYYKTFIFSIDMYDVYQNVYQKLEVWSNSSTRIRSESIPNVSSKEELYGYFDKIIKEYIFQ